MSMGLFRSRNKQRPLPEPLPDWDDTRWRSHLRSNALGTDHHCNIYMEMIQADRKEAARLFQNEDDVRARQFAESSLRNKRIVAALSALAPLCNALYQRSEPLSGYTSLIQIPEPAKSGIVTIIFAAGRLQLSYLTETVAFLREQFTSIHIDAIQSGDGDLSQLVEETVRKALSPDPPDRSDVDAELASSVKEFFGISVGPAASASARKGLGQVLPPSQPGALAGAQPTSAHSSELGGPQSPQFSASSAPAGADKTLLLERNAGHGIASPPQRSIPSVDPYIATGLDVGGADQGQDEMMEPTATRSRTSPIRLGDVERLPNLMPRPLTRSHTPSSMPLNRTSPVDDSDYALLSRYNVLRELLAA